MIHSSHHFLAFMPVFIKYSFFKIFAQKNKRLFLVNERHFGNLVIWTHCKKHHSPVDLNSRSAKSAVTHRRNTSQIGGNNAAT